MTPTPAISRAGCCSRNGAPCSTVTCMLTVRPALATARDEMAGAERAAVGRLRRWPGGGSGAVPGGTGRGDAGGTGRGVVRTRRRQGEAGTRREGVIWPATGVAHGRLEHLLERGTSDDECRAVPVLRLGRRNSRVPRRGGLGVIHFMHESSSLHAGDAACGPERRTELAGGALCRPRRHRGCRSRRPQ